MKKKLIAMAGGAFIVTLLSIQYQLHKDYVPQPLPSTMSPATTVFAFDLHEVILMPHIPNMITTFCKELPCSSFLFFLTHPSTWYCLWQSQEPVFEKAILDLSHTYPTIAPLLPLVRKVTNCQILIPETVSMINALKQHGYKVYLLSNIEQDTLHELQQKMPLLATLFDGTFTPAAHNAWSAKPDVSFYQQFYRYLTSQQVPSNYVIFVDNSKTNIKGAEAAGMYGILFTSPAALKTILESHKIIAS